MPPYTEQQRRYLCQHACGPSVGPRPAVAEFTITTGQAAKWYSRHGAETIGALDSGDLALGIAGTISRVWNVDVDTFRFNANGGDLDDWAAANPTAEVEIVTQDGTVTLLVADEHGMGPTWLNLDVSAAQNVILDMVIAGDTVTIRVVIP